MKHGCKATLGAETQGASPSGRGAGPSELARRRALLTAALRFAALGTRGKPAPPEQAMVKKWLDNWQGLGHVVTGCTAGRDLELTRYDGRGWRATLFVTGTEHSLTNATGTAWEPAPWRAVQVAARNALGNTPGVDQGPTPAEDVILP